MRSGFTFSGSGDAVLARANLQLVFDGERDTPEVIQCVEEGVPAIREVMASLRESLPLASHSGVGAIGRTGFFRIPNHYRSISYVLPSTKRGDPNPGVIVFKGTEPLLPDFPAYFDWMLGAPFRASALPLGLHFPLEMKLPPAAMWIEECVAEQAVASQVQGQYLGRYGRLARLPVPLFVFKMTSEQTGQYEEVVRSRLSKDAMWRIRNKLADGLGVEIYYYPELPVRVADLSVGNLKETFKAALAPEQVEATFRSWATLFSELVSFGYMPYAPWHHGMGGCCDTGNVCIDGGFHDLLTLVPFDAIPDFVTFRQSLLASIRLLSDSMISMAAVSVGPFSAPESDAVSLAASFITQSLRTRVQEIERQAYPIDARLKRFCDLPTPSDILHLVRLAQRDRGSAQFFGPAEIITAPPDRRVLETASVA